jgi:hypothetical protein
MIPTKWPIIRADGDAPVDAWPHFGLSWLYSGLNKAGPNLVT